MQGMSLQQRQDWQSNCLLHCQGRNEHPAAEALIASELLGLLCQTRGALHASSQLQSGCQLAAAFKSATRHSSLLHCSMSGVFEECLERVCN